MKKLLIVLLILISIPILICSFLFVYYTTPLFHPASEFVTTYSELEQQVKRSCVLPAEDLLPKECKQEILTVYYRSILKITACGYDIRHIIDDHPYQITCESTKVFKEAHPITVFTSYYRDIPIFQDSHLISYNTYCYTRDLYLGDYRYSIHAETLEQATKLAQSLIDRYLDSQ